MLSFHVRQTGERPTRLKDHLVSTGEPESKFLMVSRVPSRAFATETAPQAGKLLLRLNVVGTCRATIKARAACRRPAQQFS